MIPSLIEFAKLLPRPYTIPPHHQKAIRTMDLLNEYEKDIPRDTAVAAHAGVSHSPEQRGAAQIRDYATTLAQDRQALESLATTPEKEELLRAEFERYRQGYRARTIAYLNSRSRVMSPMITGPARFPVAANEKRSRWAQNKLTDLIGYRERALAAIRKKLDPAVGPVMAGDEDAVPRLEAQLTAAMDEQETMKLANAAIRKALKNKGSKTDAELHAGLVDDLKALDLSETAARALLRPDSFNGIGYPDYKIRNNGANIRRMQQRLDGLKAAKAQPVQETEHARGRVEWDRPANRVRLFFPGKPEHELRQKLKASGFRWAPTLGAWQAYYNERAKAAAVEIMGKVDEGHADG